MKPQKVRRRLEQAVGSGRAVDLVRDSLGQDDRGFVLSLSGGWVALQVLADGVYVDGVVLLRVQDISAVRDAHSTYVARALERLEQTLASFAIPTGADARDLLILAAGLHPFSAFAVEDDGDEALMIGRLLKAGRKQARHRFIDADGTWADADDRWKYDEIVSVYIGGRYIDALARFADPGPADLAP
ncbi:hypothetical protein [Aeromicrobium sp. CnD17-E]|uniref:hypothetical protein n=1 Tax=Aeromicrobium sp. CnD17-E TaxID=2954487 RepID=UPI0020975DF6|nr:hypothetical protein [Aeromicrobium sp. CnD17-E]MCO7237824.1 hypothetical protein [Aeromicrobium sp. CnD17-E]